MALHQQVNSIPEPEDLSRLINLAQNMPNMVERLGEIREATERLQATIAEYEAAKALHKERESLLVQKSRENDTIRGNLEQRVHRFEEDCRVRNIRLAEAHQNINTQTADLNGLAAHLAITRQRLEADAAAQNKYHKEQMAQVERQTRDASSILDARQKQITGVQDRREKELTDKETQIDELVTRLRTVICPEKC